MHNILLAVSISGIFYDLSDTWDGGWEGWHFRFTAFRIRRYDTVNGPSLKSLCFLSSSDSFKAISFMNFLLKRISIKMSQSTLFACCCFSGQTCQGRYQASLGVLALTFQLKNACLVITYRIVDANSTFRCFCVDFWPHRDCSVIVLRAGVWSGEGCEGAT